MFFKISALKHFAIFTRKHLCRNYFLIKLQACRSEILLKRDSNTDVFLECCKILGTPVSKNICKRLLLIFKLLMLLLGICRPSLLNQKHNVGWFLLIRFIDLARVYSSLVISRNHSNTFVIDMQKTKILTNVKYCNKGSLFWYQDFDSFDKLLSTTYCLI